jgi:hypothetical protein
MKKRLWARPKRVLDHGTIRSQSQLPDKLGWKWSSCVARDPPKKSKRKMKKFTIILIKN